MSAKKKAETSTPPDDAHLAALELLKQLITLSSGVLAVSAAFIANFFPGSVVQILILVGSWACLAASVYSGLQAMSAIVQSRLTPGLPWSKGLGEKYATASKYFFVAGLILFAVFALVSFLFHNLRGG